MAWHGHHIRLTTNSAFSNPEYANSHGYTMLRKSMSWNMVVYEKKPKNHPGTTVRVSAQSA